MDQLSFPLTSHHQFGQLFIYHRLRHVS
jgi:hypothetical protein